MELIANFNKQKKRNPEKQKSIQESLLKECKRLEQKLQRTLQPSEIHNCREIFDLYGIECMAELWDNSNDDEKIRMAKEMKFTCVRQSYTLCTFQTKKNPKQVYVLLKGTIFYRFSIENSQKRVQYVVKPGQILGQPVLDPQLEFTPFSLVAASSCLVLKFPFQSILRENLQKKREIKAIQLLRSLEKNFELTDGQKNMSCIIPYFSECNFRKNELILSNISTNYLCFISEGEIQIIKESKNRKSVSLTSMTAGQIFLHCPDEQENEKKSIKCKSLSCVLYLIPNSLVKNVISSEFGAFMERKSVASRSLHSQLFYKSERISVDPIKFLKYRTKKSLKKSQKAKAQSKNEWPWNLIEHVANQMKRKPQTSHSVSRPKKYSNSAHQSKRDHFQISPSKFSKLKRISQQSSEFSNFPQQQYRKTNSFTPTLKTPFQSQSAFLSKIPKILAIRAEKECRNKLIKKTKYKLIRYAQGHNLYDLNDYL